MAYGGEELNKSLQLFLLSGLAVIGIYAALVLGEVIGTTRAYVYLRSDVSVPVTLLRMCVLAMTVLPVAFYAGRAIVRRSPVSGRTALLGVAFAFTLVIGLLQVFVYDASVLGASLLKVAFAAAGLGLAAYRHPLSNQRFTAHDGQEAPRT
jgi:hypothetical protein